MNDMIRILYQDGAIAVAVKPANMLSQPDRTGAPSITSLLSQQLGREVFPIHRLDRAVGGVMIFALNRSAAGKLSALIGTDAFEKEYLAVVHGVPVEKSGKLTDYLAHDAAKNMTYVVSEKDRNAKIAELSYTLLQSDEEFSLIRVRLHTGRTHQIRVQFSSRNMALAGDGKYGARDRMGLALWSYRLTFKDPFTKKRRTFTALPDGETTPWNLFSAEFQKITENK